ncbi:hypothetical protein F5H01DRAFT_199289 [Linnemannia elongata]|nr:hypothetical protein F5H01DRAFT_199289 [Linnemannia elongata]
MLVVAFFFLSAELSVYRVTQKQTKKKWRSSPSLLPLTTNNLYFVDISLLTYSFSSLLLSVHTRRSNHRNCPSSFLLSWQARGSKQNKDCLLHVCLF